MIRDPRDRHEAMVASSRRTATTVGRSTASWIASASLGRRNERAHPDAYRVIRYEDVVTDPVASIRDLCAWIGERFEPSMLELPGASRYDAERNRSAAGSPISPAYVAGYRTTITSGDLSFIQHRAASWMGENGYALDAVPWTRAGRVRYAMVGWAGAAATMRSAQAVDRVRRRAGSTAPVSVRST
jgi:hypothetical protein